METVPIRFKTNGPPFKQQHNPGSKRFHVGGRGRLVQQEGTWGIAMTRYQTPIKQQNASAYVVQNGPRSYAYKIPRRRPQDRESMKRVPVGGSIMRVVDQGGSELFGAQEMGYTAPPPTPQDRLTVGGMEVQGRPDLAIQTSTINGESGLPTPQGSPMSIDSPISPDAIKVLEQAAQEPEAVEVEQQDNQLVFYEGGNQIDQVSEPAFRAIMDTTQRIMEDRQLTAPEAAAEAGVILATRPQDVVAMDVDPNDVRVFQDEVASTSGRWTRFLSTLVRTFIGQPDPPGGYIEAPPQRPELPFREPILLEDYTAPPIVTLPEDERRMITAGRERMGLPTSERLMIEGAPRGTKRTRGPEPDVGTSRRKEDPRGEKRKRTADGEERRVKQKRMRQRLTADTAIRRQQRGPASPDGPSKGTRSRKTR